MIDYEVLKLIWWVLIGFLLIGFAVTDGFDLGLCTMLPFVGRDNDERRLMLNSIGPHWDGNQVWLITGGASIFAAWPPVYAAAFSGLYYAMLLVLFALFLRPAGIEYRSKLDDPRWRRGWDWGLFASGAVPTLIFGVAFGNLLLGLPFQLDADMRSHYSGSFWSLLHPFALLAGVVSLAMLVMHGMAFLNLRSDGALRGRARSVGRIAALILILAFALAGVWLSGMKGLRLDALPVAPQYSILDKQVTVVDGGWLDNYGRHPWMIVAPALGFGGAMGMMLLLGRLPVIAFICSAAAVIGVILTAGFSLFPFVLPSSVDLASSLTIWDATSTHLVLSWMFWSFLLFLPLILAYTIWSYRVMRGRLTREHLREPGRFLY